MRVAAAKRRVTADPLHPTWVQRNAEERQANQERDYRFTHCGICHIEVLRQPVGRKKKDFCAASAAKKMASAAASGAGWISTGTPIAPGARKPKTLERRKPKPLSTKNSYQTGKSVSVHAFSGGAPGLGKRA
jgi:phosphodiesterase/alkaline phosphatase D-like protein